MDNIKICLEDLTTFGLFCLFLFISVAPFFVFEIDRWIERRLSDRKNPTNPSP